MKLFLLSLLALFGGVIILLIRVEEAPAVKFPVLPDLQQMSDSLGNKTYRTASNQQQIKQKDPSLRLLNLRVISATDIKSGNNTKINNKAQSKNNSISSRLDIIAVFNQKPNFSFLSLDNPPRLVLTLPPLLFTFPARDFDKNKLLASLRYGLSGVNSARMIFGLKQPFRVESVRIEPLTFTTEAEVAWQATIELTFISAKAFRQDLSIQHLSYSDSRLNGTTATDTSLPSKLNNKINNGYFVVTIDPGHGDFDSGAIGVDGVKEKQISLAFAKTLYRILQEKKGIKPYLTRDNDVFLRLGARVEKARTHNTNLFISIHADHIDVPGLHGATVYTLSDKASDDMAKLLAEYENKTDLLDGLPADEPQAVAGILLDMTRRETRIFSETFARMLVQSIQSGGIALTNNPHRSAGFQVLRAADIPSVLLELGYLSNRKDEKNITNPIWREKMAHIVADTITNYIQSHIKR